MTIETAWNSFKKINQERLDKLMQESKEGLNVESNEAIKRVQPTINVLDHGYVTLVDFMGSDLSIVRAARCSFSAQWRAGEDQGSDQRLINYLWKHRHTTPFEAVTFTFEVKAPIFIFRQWHRHRIASYNELSARYKELPEEYYVPHGANIGSQSKNSKQARDIADEPLPADEMQQRLDEIDLYTKACKASYAVYKELIDGGWPRELARAVLPVSMYSVMQVTWNLHSLAHFLKLRMDPHAQWEIQQYAKAMLALITPIVPVATAAMFSEPWIEGAQP